MRAELEVPQEPAGTESVPSNAQGSRSAPVAAGKKVWLIVGAVCLAVLGAALAGRWVGTEQKAAVEAGPKAPVVRVSEARRGSIPLIGQYRGELVAEVAELAARNSGRLLLVEGQIGDAFEKGKLLAQIDALEPQRQLAEARAQVQAASAAEQRVEAQLAAARVELERGQRLKAEALVSDQELTALRSQVGVLEAELVAAKAQGASAQARVALFREQIADARLVAPFDGAIAERYLDPGSNVQPNTPILRLVRSGPLRVRFRVPERDLRHLKQGSEVQVSTQATGERRFPGTLTRISAEVSRTDRSLAAEALLQDEHDVLRPGMYADVSLTFGSLEEVTLVPSGALFERVADGDRPETNLFVIEDGKAVRKQVTELGRHLDSSAVEGVEPGAQVVIFGHEALRDGGPASVVQESAR